MPQGGNANKSGNQKKKRAPAHKNSFAFQHNPKSKLTLKILNAPIDHVCRRCRDKLEWRKAYRKYKPRTQPGTCNMCKRRNVLAAYHTICTKCTVSATAKSRVLQSQQQPISSGKETSSEDASLRETKNDLTDGLQLLRVDGDGDKHRDETSEDETTCKANHNKPVTDIHRACAMCVKEPALPDVESEDGDSVPLHSANGRRLKLREQKAMERKLVKEQEQAKLVAKEKRRQEREGGKETAADDDDDSVLEGNDKAEGDIEANERADVGDDLGDEEQQEEDPFLKAVGGADRLLTGKAYQEMLLQTDSTGTAS